MSCGFFYDGILWVQPTEVHVWDGTTWIQAIEVHAYENDVWRRIFPCEVVTLLEETSLILDTGQVIKISRDTIKGPFVELVGLTEAVLLSKRFTTAETMSILDLGILNKINRNVVKGPFGELIDLSETGSILRKRKVSASETMLILDKGSVTKISRDILILTRELILATETGAISITDTTPIIDFCTIENVVVDNKARVRFDPGDFCESVRIDKIVDGSHSFHQNMNTTPNTTAILSNYYNGTCPEVVSFRVHPFNANGQSGTAGTECSTSNATLGTEGCK